MKAYLNASEVAKLLKVNRATVMRWASGQRETLPRRKRIEGMAAEILDVDGAAKLLGVSKRTVYNLAHEKTLPGTKVGREWRFSRKRLIEWVSGTIQAQGDTNPQPQSLDELLRSLPVRAMRRD
jgi:excisionase family DNA binding protein